MRDRGEVARSPEALRPCQRRVEVHDGVPPASRERDHLARPLHQVDLAKVLAAESWQHFVHEFARAARQVQPEACSGAPDQIGARRVERLAWHRGREEDPPFVAHEECVPRGVAPWILVDERSRALWARKQPAPHRSVVVLGSRARLADAASCERRQTIHVFEKAGLARIGAKVRVEDVQCQIRSARSPTLRVGGDEVERNSAGR
mmetsp:Transcript_805/g.2610  ORF Transcript_805/g.2610 Transcript_805/m.2610 type:complete len:205 (-) Transcript_805:352-966(-)